MDSGKLYKSNCGKVIARTRNLALNCSISSYLSNVSPAVLLTKIRFVKLKDRQSHLIDGYYPTRMKDRRIYNALLERDPLDLNLFLAIDHVSSLTSKNVGRTDDIECVLSCCTECLGKQNRSHHD